MKEILNQLFEIEKKSQNNQLTLFDRNLKRMFYEMEKLGYSLKNPLGEKFTEERTDVEAKITGELHPAMKVTKVLKPIIYKKTQDQAVIIQKGVVIVE